MIDLGDIPPLIISLDEQIAALDDMERRIISIDKWPDWLRIVPRHRSLVRLQDVPHFAMYWYYALHQNLFYPSFIEDYFMPDVKIRGMRAYGEWRGVYGSFGT